MIYICNDCGFLFRRFGEVVQCPQCESKHIRTANIEETAKAGSLLGISPKCNTVGAKDE